MFISDGEKKAKEKVLAELLGNLEEMDGEKIGKKPMMAEMSVTSIEPKEEGDMEEEGEDMESDSSMTPEDKALLMQLVSKYLK